MTEPQPTPQHVMDAISAIAEHLKARGFQSAVIAPNGGTAFLSTNALRDRMDYVELADLNAQERDEARRWAAAWKRAAKMERGSRRVAAGLLSHCVTKAQHTARQLAASQAEAEGAGQEAQRLMKERDTLTRQFYASQSALSDALAELGEAREETERLRAALRDALGHFNNRRLLHVGPSMCYSGTIDVERFEQLWTVLEETTEEEQHG